MTKTFPALLTCCILGQALATSSIMAQDYVVSPGGDDSNAGTSAALAWKTIQHAAALAEPGDVISMRAGTYRESVRPAHSGREGAPIVFQGYGDEAAVVSGADPVGPWHQAAADAALWETPLPADFFASTIDQADQVFRDGRMIHEGRWPDAGADLSHPATATISRFISKTRTGNVTTAVFEDDRLDPAAPGRYVGATIHLQPNAAGWGWTLTGTVVAQQGHRLTMTSPNDAGEDGHGDRYAVGSRYFLFGLNGLADSEGEWFHDRASGTLRLRSARDPGQDHVEVKRRDYGFDLSERSWIVVRHLSLFACSLTSDAQAGGDGVPVAADGAARFPWRPTGFVAAASHLVVDGLDCSYLNHFTDLRGHFYLQWTHQTGLVLAGTDHVVRGCTIRATAGNGISLQGRRHRCIGNTILDSDYASVDCAAISCGVQDVAEDFEIAWNTITRCARSGMTLRGLRNSDATKLVTRIHHNDVSDWLCQDWDGGAFYLFGMDGRFVRIDHNHFHCTEPRSGMVSGAYWDFSKNYILDHNVIWGVPTPIQITHAFDDEHAKINNLLIYRNTAISNDAAWGYPIGGSQTGNGTLVQDNIFKVCAFAKPGGGHENGWPSYGDGAVTVQGNLLYGDFADAYWSKAKRLHPHDQWSAQAGFMTTTPGDYRLAANSPARDAGTPIPAVERDGIAVQPYEDTRVGAAYDLGALEAGSEPFAVGAAAAPH